MAYDLPSWLQGSPDEPAKIFLQAASVGGQIGQGAMANINRARAINEGARQFDEQQRRVAMLDQIQQGILAYKLEEAQLQVQKMKLAKDYEFQTSKAEIEIGNLLNTTDPRDPMFRRNLGAILARYPAASRSDIAKHAMELPFQAEKLDIDRLRASKETTPNAADEAAIANQLAREEAVAFSKTGQPWTQEQRATRAAELGALKDFKPAFKGGITFDDQGRIQQVSFGDQPTVATASFVQKNINIAEKNYQLLDELDRNLRDADLGIRGVLGEVVDRYAPQFGLPGFDPKRASNREVLKVSVQGMVRQISSDTRFTEADRKRAEDAMVSFGAGENKERATAVLRELKDIIRSRAKIDAVTGGMPQPEFTYSKDEIISAVQSGKMTKEKAMELRQRYYPQDYGPPSTR